MPADPKQFSRMGKHVLRRADCGKSNEVTHSELLGYTKRGWPKCCSTTMGYYVKTDPQTITDDNTPEGPALPPP